MPRTHSTFSNLHVPSRLARCGAWLALTAMIGCGRFLVSGAGSDVETSKDGTEPSSAAQTYGVDGGAMNDPHTPNGGPGARRCTPSSPFVETTNLDLDNSRASAFTMESLLSFRLSRVGAGSASFFGAGKDRRLTTATLVGSTIEITLGGVDALDDSDDPESQGAISQDGLHLVFERSSSDLDRSLWVSARASLGAPWSPPQRLSMTKTIGTTTTGGSSSASITKYVEGIEAYLVGTTLYFAANADTVPAQLDIFAGSIDFDAARVENVQKVAGVATSTDESAPVLSDDELEIFYASGTSSATDRVFHASRASTAEPFSSAGIVTGPVNAASASGDGDYPTWISPDGCELYAIGRRDGSFAMRRFRRQPL